MVFRAAASAPVPGHERNPPTRPPPFRAVILAIVAPSFNAFSETFVADHVRSLAPGATVLVCSDSVGAEIYGCPVLSHVCPHFTTFGPLDAMVKKVYVALRRRFGRPLDFADSMRMMEFFKAHGVDRVLAEFGQSGALVADVCARLGLPLYVYFRGADASAAIERGLTRRRYVKMFRQVRGVFCVSQFLADRLISIGCPPDLITINPSGVLTEAFPLGSPEPGRLIAVGRLVEKKAPHLTLDAFGRIAGRFPQAHLDMIGDGPLAAKCHEMIARHGLEQRVTMHGSMDHASVARLMGRSAIFVQHSVTAPDKDMEGFPTAIAEAMSVGLTVVSTRHSGIPEHVLHEKTGLLVEEGDVAGMAAELGRALEDPDFARMLGLAARAHAIVHLDRLRARQHVRAVMGLPEPAQPPA